MLSVLRPMVEKDLEILVAAVLSLFSKGTSIFEENAPEIRAQCDNCLKLKVRCQHRSCRFLSLSDRSAVQPHVLV